MSGWIAVECLNFETSLVEKSLTHKTPSGEA